MQEGWGDMRYYSAVLLLVLLWGMRTGVRAESVSIIKARFVRLEDTKGDSCAGGKRIFVVETKRGEMRCEIGSDSPGARLLAHMKRATPVLLKGRRVSGGKRCEVEKMLQGWGRSRYAEISR